MNAETGLTTGAAFSQASLQWGRVLMNAETVNAEAQLLADVRASMGPRSDERGNAATLRAPSPRGQSFNGAAF